MVVRQFCERAHDEREYLARSVSPGYSTCPRNDRRGCTCRLRDGQRPIDANAERLPCRILRSTRLKRLGEPDAQRGNDYSLHRVQPVINERIAATQNCLAFAKQRAQQSAIKRRVPCRREARRKVLAVQVESVLATRILE